MKKNLKSLLVILLTISFSLSVFACGGKGTSESKDENEAKPEDKATSQEQESSASGEKFKVAFIARAQADSFASWLTNAIKDKAKEYDDIDLEVFDGEASDEKENSMIENAITKKFDCIIVQPNNGEAQRPYVEKIVEAGIIAITTNARIDGIEGASSVDADPYAQAKVNCDLAVEQVPENAKVVVLVGPPGNFHSDERRKAWEEEFFKKRPDVEIVAEEIANWNKDEAMKFMETWVQAQDQIDAIVSMNDNMCAGALEAVKDNSKFESILAYGVDGTAEALLLIKDGKMTSTCLQSAYDLTDLIFETAYKLLTGVEKEINTDIGNPIITSENVDQYIEILKKAGAIKD